MIYSVNGYESIWKNLSGVWGGLTCVGACVVCTCMSEREGEREGRTEGSREGGRERGEMQPASTAVLPGGRVSIIPFCTTSSTLLFLLIQEGFGIRHG